MCLCKECMGYEIQKKHPKLNPYHLQMNTQEAFIEFIGNLEYLRKKQKLTPNAAHSLLSGSPLTIYAEEASTEAAAAGAKASRATTDTTSETRSNTSDSTLPSLS